MNSTHTHAQHNLGFYSFQPAKFTLYFTPLSMIKNTSFNIISVLLNPLSVPYINSFINEEREYDKERREIVREWEGDSARGQEVAAS